MVQTILLIDYENIQDVNLSLIQEKDIKLKIFVGHSQNKLPFDLIQATQRFGGAVEWIKIEGNGSDSLDFHIAFFLGKLSKENANLAFVILSKDKGFDPLVRYLCKNNIVCKRIENLLELIKKENKVSSQNEKLTAKVVENLSKIEKEKRPRKRDTLRQYTKALFAHTQLNDHEIDELVNFLFTQKKVAEVSNRLTYNF